MKQGRGITLEPPLRPEEEAKMVGSSGGGSKAGGEAEVMERLKHREGINIWVIVRG